jgi:hypothetical protein
VVAAVYHYVVICPAVGRVKGIGAMTAVPNEYEEVLAQVQRLDAAAQRRLLVELTMLIEQEDAPQAKRSLRELRGLGKEIWEGIDAQEYVARERASWTR